MFVTASDGLTGWFDNESSTILYRSDPLVYKQLRFWLRSTLHYCPYCGATDSLGPRIGSNVRTIQCSTCTRIAVRYRDTNGIAIFSQNGPYGTALPVLPLVSYDSMAGLVVRELVPGWKVIIGDANTVSCNFLYPLLFSGSDILASYGHDILEEASFRDRSHSIYCRPSGAIAIGLSISFIGQHIDDFGLVNPVFSANPVVQASLDYWQTISSQLFRPIINRPTICGFPSAATQISNRTLAAFTGFKELLAITVKLDSTGTKKFLGTLFDQKRLNKIFTI